MFLNFHVWFSSASMTCYFNYKALVWLLFICMTCFTVLNSQKVADLGLKKFAEAAAIWFPLSNLMRYSHKDKVFLISFLLQN